MTSTEAFQAMESGARVTHRLFDSDEWMEMAYGLIVFEDGVNCTVEQFFHDRKDIAHMFEDGYSIIETEGHKQ